MSPDESASCPSPDTLRDFALGTLDGPAMALLRNHIGSCAGCRARIEALAHAAEPAIEGRREPKGNGPGSEANTAIVSPGEIFAGRQRLDEVLQRAPSRSEVLREGDHVRRFKVLAELGRGGMGIVYLAEDQNLRRQVALKVLPSFAEESDERRRRLLREARAAAAVNHPNVAVIYEVGEVDGRVFLAMERVSGETLRALLRRGRVGIEEAVHLAIQILRGLGAIHGAGLVHRDLKPENIMIAVDGTVKLLDFGVAKRRSEPQNEAQSDESLLTADGQVVGTPAYMAPEQLFRGEIDDRTDIFSFGVLLYEMLTGVHPFRSGNGAAVIVRSSDRMPESPCDVRVEIGRALSDLVLRCIDRNRDRRPRDCASLEVELSELLPNTVSLAPVGRSTRSSPARRPAAAPIWAAVAATSVLSAIAWVGWQRARGVEHAERRSTPAIAAQKEGRWVLACPPFRTNGFDEPSGWLGAAAAATFCQRARILLGGLPEHTLVPAELLGLPSTLTEKLQEAPYDAADARERALIAARRATAYVEGEVEGLGGEFQVRLTLRLPDDRELASGRGASPALYAAIRQATEPLRAALPSLPRDLEIARWTKTPDLEAALALTDVQLAEYQNAGTFDAECAHIAQLQQDIGPHRDFWRTWCAEVRGRPSPPLTAPKPSSPDPATFLYQAWLYHLGNESADFQAIARNLQTFARREPSVWGRSLLAGTEACFWQSIDMDSARAAALRAVELAPKNSDLEFCAPWPILTTTLSDGPGSLSAFRAATSWIPWVANVWIFQSGTDSSEQLRGASRAYLLSPENAWAAATLFDRFLRTGDRERARAIALRTQDSEVPVLALESQILLMRLEASEAKFASAFARAERALGQPSRDGYARHQLAELVWRGFEIAQVLGRDAEFADLYVHAVVLADPPVLDRDDTLYRTAPLCAASTLAARCVARLRQLIRSSYLRSPSGETEAILQAAERKVAGDLEGAARALRPLAANGPPSDPAIGWLMVSVFDALGAIELADQVDRSTIDDRGEFNGVDLGHVRAARRHRKDDIGMAKTLARKIIAAWRTADQTPPVLRELRWLLGRPSPPERHTKNE